MCSPLMINRDTKLAQAEGEVASNQETMQHLFTLLYYFPGFQGSTKGSVEEWK